jgi:lysophospholipase L1-like esterase
MPEKKRLVRRVGVPAGLVLLSLALALVLAEAAVRHLNPYGVSYYRDTNRYLNEAIELPPDAARPDGRLFQNRPNARMDLPDFTFRTNALGLRSGASDGGIGVEPDPGRARALFLGDSVTLGWGVDDAVTWVRTIEREARFADGRPLECLNAGHLQYNTVQELDWLRTFGPALRPDAVVLTFVVNDLDDMWAAYLEFQRAAAVPPTAAQRAKGRILGWIRGLHGLYHFFASRADARTSDELKLERVEDAPEYEARWARTVEALDGMRATCAELGAPFVVLDHTTPRIPDVRRWCEDRGVAWYDLTFTDAEWARDVRNSLADSHANELGNRILADKALPALRDAGILAEARD